MSTAEVIDYNKATSVNALFAQIKAAWDRADQKKADADQWYVRTGRLLIDLKAKATHGQWLPTLKKLGRSQQRASELMEMAKDPKALEEQRERKRVSVAKTRAKSPLRSGDLDAPQPDHEPEPQIEQRLYKYGEGQEEERWQNSLANLCGDIISHRAYWSKHFPGWEEFECPSHIKTLVREAVTELASITATVTGR